MAFDKRLKRGQNLKLLNNKNTYVKNKTYNYFCIKFLK